ncbi:MAG: T9SS type A sorting domain-containing protein [Ignavibacteriaceae bacterium]
MNSFALFNIIILTGISVVSAQTHFQPIWSSPYLPMNIYVTSAELSSGYSLGVGDEIGVFDGSNCVGVGLLTGPIDPYIAIVASTDDPTTPTIDGFISGDTVMYKLWIAGTLTEIENVSALYTVGNGTFVSQGTAVLSLVGELIMSIKPNNQNVYKFSLSQNFPNPFNPVTTIEYEINNDTDVRIVLYNEIGQEILTLINESQSAGKHIIKINATNLPSGVYYYRMFADGFTSTKKILLIK